MLYRIAFVVLAGLAFLHASPVLLAYTPAETWAELDGRPGLERVRTPRFSAAVFALEPRDLDQDADLDVVLRNRLTREELAWWRNDGRGALSAGEAERLFRPAQAPSRNWQASERGASRAKPAAPSPSAQICEKAGNVSGRECPARPSVGASYAQKLPAFTPPLRGPPSCGFA